MRIEAPWGSVDLLPAIELTNVNTGRARTITGCWALPGGAILYSWQVRQLVRQQGWTLMEESAAKDIRTAMEPWGGWAPRTELPVPPQPFAL